MNEQWPRPGRCGACGRPAHQFPSLRWKHTGPPCAQRSQFVFAIEDDPPPCVFVPDGRELPQPGGHRLVPVMESGELVATAMEVESPQRRQTRWDRVRACLAADAEARS